MAIFINGQSGDFKDVPPGLHVAVCYMIVDMGLQKTTYAGETSMKHKLYLRFETPEERTDDNRPLSIGLFCTATLGKKSTLRGILEQWRGRPFTEEELQKFDVTAVLGKACQISVSHDAKGDKTYANIRSVVPLSKGQTPPKAENTLIQYGPDATDQYDLLPDWIKERVAAPQAQGAASTENDDSDSDVPF